MILRIACFAGLLLLTFAGYQAIKAHYLPHGEGYRFPETELTHVSHDPTALAPLWYQSPFTEYFYARGDGLGMMQFQVYAYFDHKRPHPVYWSLEDMDHSGGPAVERSGTFPATEMHDYGFIRLRFEPLAKSAGRLYKFTLKAPETPFRECGAITLYPAMDRDSAALARPAKIDRGSFSVLYDQSGERGLAPLTLGPYITASQVIAPHQRFLTSIQLQLEVQGPSSHRLKWSITRNEDKAEIGSGELEVARIDDWDFADLYLREREHCAGRTYTVSISDLNATSTDTPVRLPLFPLKGSSVTVDAPSAATKEDFSAHIVILDSPSVPGLRLFDAKHDDFLASGEYLSSDTTLWYFPRD